MEKAAEFDMEEGILDVVQAAGANISTHASTKDEAIKAKKFMELGVTKQVRIFESAVNEMVEETIGQKDKHMKKANALSRSVAKKVSRALARVKEYQQQDPDKMAYVNQTFMKIINHFMSNYEEFERRHGAQSVPDELTQQLLHLMRSDEGGDFGDRDQTMEVQMMDLIHDPAKYGLKPYDGQLKKGHHYEEYMKQIVIVKQFQKHRGKMLKVIHRYKSGSLSSAEFLQKLVGFSSLGKAWVPTMWLTYGCVKDGEWNYSAWIMDDPPDTTLGRIAAAHDALRDQVPHPSPPLPQEE